MKSTKIYIITLLALFALGGCLQEDKIDQVVRVKLQFPEGYENIDPSTIEISLSNLTSGLTYRSTCNSEGIASFAVEYGFYQAMAQHKYKEGRDIHVLNGRIEHMALTPQKGEDKDVYTIDLVHAKLQQLIIKEFYFAGCKDDSGAKNYIKDSYITIYNNSDETASLDSLCVGMLFNLTNNSPSTFLTNGITDRIPIMTLGWQIPGTGNDYLLKGGEEVTLALNAVNHSSIQGYSQSVDLSKVKFAFWDESLAQNHQKEAAVIPLEIFWKSNSPANIIQYSWGATGPAIVLYRIEGTSAEAYAKIDKNKQKEPGKENNTTAPYFLMIPTGWVVDGIECSSVGKTNKRLTPDIDAGLISVGNMACGLSAHRKVQETTSDGRIIYQDTNNTTEDFEIVTPALKR